MKVSICMITYNHEKFIKEAIHSVLNQKTNFDIELVVAEDNSPDDSETVINSIINDHPKGNCIKYIRNKQNLGPMPNFSNAIKFCDGNYVALCEGDDYWTDNYKLQKQVDFLEQNKKFSMCFHPIQVLQDDTLLKDTITREVRPVTTIYELAKGNFIHTCSVVYRNHLFPSFPDNFDSSPIGDYYIHMLNARYGKIYKMNEPMAVYRIHNNSYWSSKKESERIKVWVSFLELIIPNFNFKTQTLLRDQMQMVNGTYSKPTKFQRIIRNITFFLKDTLKL